MGALVLFIVLGAILESPQLQQQLFQMLLVLGLLIGGLRFAFGLLPSWVQHPLSALTRAVINLIFGTGNKGRARPKE